MKIYIICPVRKATQEQEKDVNEYINFMEKNGHEIHSYKNVDQNDETGINIILNHAYAMDWCDRVDIFWDTTSEGSAFDLGMAIFAAKKLKLIKVYGEDKPGKSFLKVIKKIEEIQTGENE